MGHGGKLLGVMVGALLWMPAVEMLHPVNTHAQEASSPDKVAAARLAAADRFFQQGVQQLNLSQFRQALQFWQWALELYQDPAVQIAFPQESRWGEGAALASLGNAYLRLDQYQQAIDFYEQSLVIFSVGLELVMEKELH